MSQLRILMLAGVVCLLAGCSTDPRARAIGQAYVGPSTLELRKDLSANAESIATLKHGEPLEILEFRRRFVKVRNMGSAEGWLDSRQLLAQSQMDALRQLGETARTLPSQGKATVFDTLNVHLEPNRYSPSPYQLAPNTLADVVGHAATERVLYRSPVMDLAIKPKIPVARKPKRKSKEAAEEDKTKEPPPAPSEVGPPAMPHGPAVPADWMELSRVGRSSASTRSIEADDWTLVRLEPGKAGWVLTRNLLMHLPDSITRYAGGHRVMAALPLGEVQDGAEKKTHWLWATITDRLRPYQFDGYRVFAYNLNRRRFETALWEKNVRGFYPITLGSVEVADKRSTATAQGFTVVVEEPDGSRWKRTYAFLGTRVKLVKKEPAEKAAEAPLPGHVLSSSLPPPQPDPEKPPTVVNKVKELLRNAPKQRSLVGQ